MLEQEMLSKQEIEVKIRTEYQLRSHEIVAELLRENREELNETKKRLNAKYQHQLEETKKHYEKLLEKAKEKSNDIIDLTEESAENESKLTRKVTTLTIQLETLHKEKNFLEQILEESNIEFLDLQDRYDKLFKSHVELQEKYSSKKKDLNELEERFSVQALEQQERIDYVEELEEQLNMTLDKFNDRDDLPEFLFKSP